VNTIVRMVTNIDRLMEIINTMPKPEVDLIVVEKGTFNVKKIHVIARNKDGVCECHFICSGDEECNYLEKKLEKIDGI